MRKRKFTKKETPIKPYIKKEDINLKEEDLILCVQHTSQDKGAILYDQGLSDHYLWKVKDKYSYLTRQQAISLAYSWLESDIAKDLKLFNDQYLNLRNYQYQRRVRTYITLRTLILVMSIAILIFLAINFSYNFLYWYILCLFILGLLWVGCSSILISLEQ